ncbi:DUF2157 domain-containing protein [Paenibacillus psychroresistens]|uniref:DUF2157 domain-containing protein n=2 Tax=Paenibacillus psychroresistens TaxID=1778678 RepID=A0A6B8RQN3_9BACL|nr:DUF2157 domain-containing protein [Paenibacillus psychroresistens]
MNCKEVIVMNRKLIETEGQRWVELGIVTPVQYKQILKLYTERDHAIGLVPLLGSILLGLGLISFIAANWQGISELFRLIIILIALCGFYFTGEALLRKNQEKLGIACIGLGLISFGTGIILIAQMFHLQAYDVSSWIVWGIAGAAVTYLYRSRYLFLLTLIIVSITEWYSVVEFNHFSYLTFAIMIIGLGSYVWIRKDSLVTWLFSISFIIQSFMLVEVNDWHFLWNAIPVILLYTLGDAVQESKIRVPFQSAALISIYLFDLFFIIIVGNQDHVDLYDHLLAKTFPFLISVAFIFVISIYLKLRQNRGITGFDWILLPVLLYLPFEVDILYIFILFLFSSFILWRGYVEGWRFKINLGTLLFLCSTMAAYIKLTWDFMDKSLFFIIGGSLLLGLSWVLNRRRNKFLEDNKEVIDRD